MKSLRIPPISNGPAKIQLSRISHVYFEHPDLDDFARFAEAFGFVQTYRDRNTIYFRGYGKTTSQSSDGAKAFKCAAFVVASEGDFEKACKLPDSTVSQLKGPGGGRKVTIKRPASTFVHVIYGQQERAVPTEVPTATHEDQGPYNHAIEKERKGRFQRYRAGLAMVHKLGHYGYVCKDFDQEVAFYTEKFNSVPSDVLYFPNKPDIDVMTFIYLDLGEEYSDHHSIFSQRAPPGIDTYVHHTSYEVEDFDTQLLDHQWLAKKKAMNRSGVWAGTYWDPKYLIIGRTQVDSKSSTMQMATWSTVKCQPGETLLDRLA